MGAEVLGYALAPEGEPNLFTRARVGEGIEHLEADVRDFARLRATCARFRPQTVFHLAAQPLVRRAYREPKDTFDINVGGTVNMLEAVRVTPSVETAVIITTDKCYENREWVYGYRENDPLGGRDPYSASKAAAEMAVSAYARSFGGERRLGIASTRAGNVLGGGDWAEDRIIPDALRALDAGRPLEVRHPQAVRPWQHVLEPLSGYLALAARLARDPTRYGGAWNFGPAERSVATVADLVSRFLRELGRGEWRDGSAEQKDAPHEAGLLWLAVDKAAAELHWHPVFSTERAIDTTARWYRRVLFENGDAHAACLDDVRAYVAAARERGAWWVA